MSYKSRYHTAKRLGKLAASLSATKPGQRLFGGLGDDKSHSDFPKNKLEAGARVEQEHTSNKGVAKEITMDHLTEDPNYYTKFREMEAGE